MDITRVPGANRVATHVEARVVAVVAGLALAVLMVQHSAARRSEQRSAE